ncbi:MAG TPA: helix-turn-helix domain-containing protein [Candidatus Saccharimonadales bacterium]|nr:helix-turn-helix domain-containing protein [Candidatus Saccharimonadales bacterium]
MKRTDTKSHCPINYSLETFGDPWSLLIIRDIVCYGKRTYGEFLASKERISSRTLATRLEHLVMKGVLAKQTHETDKRKEVYTLTYKGKLAVPILIELATWGSQFDPQTASPHSWLEAVQADKINSAQSNRAALLCGR